MLSRPMALDVSYLVNALKSSVSVFVMIWQSDPGEQRLEESGMGKI